MIIIRLVIQATFLIILFPYIFLKSSLSLHSTFVLPKLLIQCAVLSKPTEVVMRSRFFSQTIKRTGTPYNFIWDVKTLTERLAKPNHEACFEQIKSINNLVLQTNGRPLFILPRDVDYMSKKAASSLIKTEFPGLSHLSDDFLFLESVQHCLERNEYTFSDSDQKELFSAYYSKIGPFGPYGKNLGLDGVNRVLLTAILRKMGYPEPELDWDKLLHNRIELHQLDRMKDHIILCADPAHRVFFSNLIDWLCWRMPGENNVCSIENAGLLLAKKIRPS